MGEKFGVGMTAKVLRGSKDQKIIQFKLDSLSTYGILSNYTEKELMARIQFLIAEQVLATEEGKFPTLKLNKQSVDVLKGERTVWMYTTHVPVTETADYDENLFAILRELRRKIAAEDKVPPYVIFSDATLKDLCRYLPVTKEDMLQIKGIGEKRFEQYGEPFAQAIHDWQQHNPAIKPKIQITNDPGMRQVQQPRKMGDSNNPSHIESYKLFQGGKSIKEIAIIRGMVEQTIENHLFKAYKEGQPITWGIFFNKEEETVVLDAHRQIEEKRLKPLKDTLPDSYTYRKMKAILIKNGLL